MQCRKQACRRISNAFDSVFGIYTNQVVLSRSVSAATWRRAVKESVSATLFRANLRDATLRRSNFWTPGYSSRLNGQTVVPIRSDIIVVVCGFRRSRRLASRPSPHRSSLPHRLHARLMHGTSAVWGMKQLHHLRPFGKPPRFSSICDYVIMCLISC